MQDAGLFGGDGVLIDTCSVITLRCLKLDPGHRSTNYLGMHYI